MCSVGARHVVTEKARHPSGFPMSAWAGRSGVVVGHVGDATIVDMGNGLVLHDPAACSWDDGAAHRRRRQTYG